ncbi:MAG: nitrate- and nitrite sensing domain-containing protein, partial [Thiomicrorhabdus sp.]|nr:nitrate- and nitrite sensing domain-containing protein [Thiomicrorhabdus sp.]
MNNLSIKNKLQILVFVSLGLALYFGVAHVLATYQAKTEMNRTAVLAQLGAEMGDLLHTSQTERDLSTGYLASKGTKFSTELAQNKKAFDRYLDKLEKEVEHLDGSLRSEKLDKYIKAVFNHLNTLNAIRAQVQALEIPASQAIAYYSQLNK